MFFGETLCILAFFVLIKRKETSEEKAQFKKFPISNIKQIILCYLSQFHDYYHFWTFGLPAMCDMTATTLMYIGLLLVFTFSIRTFRILIIYQTTPSVYQMLRGMIVVFTGLLSWMFLGRRLYAFQWVGMFLIIVGYVYYKLQFSKLTYFAAP